MCVEVTTSRDRKVRGIFVNLGISPAELKHRLDTHADHSALLLDVREPDEFVDWRIDGSINVPLETLAKRETLQSLPRDREIIAICAHGIRSGEAAAFLSKKGYSSKHLAGGLSAWNKVHDTASVPYDGQDGFKILQIRRIGKGCASYILAHDDEAIVVDPSTFTNEYLALAKRNRVKIRHVLDTHQHADHISGARNLAEASDAELHLNPLDPYKYHNFTPLRDGAHISVGNDASIQAIHTPGHTKGSTSFLIQERALLTGDILFLEGVARPDLHDRVEEFAADLYETYQEKILSLPQDTIILPAHFSRDVRVEYGKPFHSTLGEIRERIPLLNASRDEFLGYVLRHIPPTPPNYESILKINRGESRYDPEVFEELEEGPNRCALKA